MKTIALVVAAFFLVVALPFLPAIFSTLNHEPVDRVERNLPWQIESQPDGKSRVLGVLLGQNTLADARHQLGEVPQVALVMAPGETGALEAYFDKFSAGFVSGKLILTVDTTPEMREEMVQRAVKAEYMESSTRRVELGESDRKLADGLLIVAMTFIPTVQLDEPMVRQRFGEPVERIRSADGKEHFLYPAQGLDVVLDANGKELLQYVAPRDFARLRAPLQKVSSSDSKS
jgi:hypothetical protein